jgi:4-hydroxy-3-methylbut-2-enyl diphosphate reductase
MVDEAKRDKVGLPSAPVVLITAHGVSDRERDRLRESGKHLIDTTCPLVRRAHDTARKRHDEGYFVVVIGRRGHVEVCGVVGDLQRYAIVESPEEVTHYAEPRIAIVCQTTAPPGLVATVREALARANEGAEIRFEDTVCFPTKDRQGALDRLLDRVDCVVVVGGRNSNNTKELVASCRARGKPSHHVESAREVDPGWFSGHEIIGLTAGTSTLDETIDEVHEALLRCAVSMS